MANGHRSGSRDGLMRRYALLVAGWVLVVAGGILMFVPVPIPLIGVMPLLIGLALLTANSKPVRRRLQYARHRLGWLSRLFDRVSHRSPGIVKHMIRKTNPLPHTRLTRMRGQRGNS